MPYIGLDLGSTNTSAAIFENGRTRMIELTPGGAVTMPSVVCIANSKVVVGQEAVDAARLNPEHDFRNWKRHLAEKWHPMEDQGPNTCEGKKLDEATGEMVPDGMVAYEGPNGATYSPVEIASYVIAEAVHAANQYLGDDDPVTGVVIGVPATFTPNQIAAVKEAARQAGLENVFTLEEPVAAAIANGVDAKKARCVFVVDFGGGTLDTTIIRFGGGHIDIIAKNGNGDLGGADYDSRIAECAINLFKAEVALLRRQDGPSGEDTAAVKLRDAAMSRVHVEAEAVKKRLSDRDATTFRIDNIHRTPDGVSLHMISDFTRDMFGQLTQDLQARVITALKATIEDAKRDDQRFSMTNDIHDILLVGGMTRVPSVRQLVADFFGRPPNKGENAEQAVAQGLAIKAAIIEGRRRDITLQDILSFDVAVESTNNVPSTLIQRGTNFPLKKSFPICNADDDQTEISVRLVYVTRMKAQDCHLLEARDVPIDPCPAGKRTLHLEVEIDDEGHPSILSVA